jgi:hypothetical protein
MTGREYSPEPGPGGRGVSAASPMAPSRRFRNQPLDLAPKPHPGPPSPIAQAQAPSPARRDARLPNVNSKSPAIKRTEFRPPPMATAGLGPTSRHRDRCRVGDRTSSPGARPSAAGLSEVERLCAAQPGSLRHVPALGCPTAASTGGLAPALPMIRNSRSLRNACSLLCIVLIVLFLERKIGVSHFWISKVSYQTAVSSFRALISGIPVCPCDRSAFASIWFPASGGENVQGIGPLNSGPKIGPLNSGPKMNRESGRSIAAQKSWVFPPPVVTPARLN